MKRFFSFVTLLVLFSVAGVAVSASPAVTLPTLPALGTPMKTLPDMLSWQLVDRTTVLPCFEALIDKIDYTIAIERKKRRVVWISTQSPSFVAPESVSVRTRVGELLARYPGKLVEEPGFGSYVPLPSGWAALVQREGKLDPESRVQLFFRRDLQPSAEK